MSDQEHEKLINNITYILIQFCSAVYVYIGYKMTEIKLLTNLSYHCIAFGIDILYFPFAIGLVIIICEIIVDV